MEKTPDKNQDSENSAGNKGFILPIPKPNDKPNDKSNDKEPSDKDSILELILKTASDTSFLDGLSLGERIGKILDLRLKNEIMITSLLKIGVEYDKISVENAASINSKNKDSISDLVKIKQLLDGLATERISVEEISEVNNIRRRVFESEN